MFVTVIGATVGIGTPSNNTVTTAILQNGSVTTAKIVDANVTTDKLAADAVNNAKIGDNAVRAENINPDAVTTAKILNANVTTVKIADEAVTLAKLEHGTSSNNGKFLRANNGADPTFETVDLTGFVASTGGTFSGIINAFGGILLGSNDTIKFDSDDADTNHISFKGPLSLSSTVTYTLPEDGSNGQFLKTNGSGVLSFDTVSTDLVADTSPQLGGDLQSNGNDIDLSLIHI